MISMYCVTIKPKNIFKNQSAFIKKNNCELFIQKYKSEHKRVKNLRLS